MFVGITNEPRAYAWGSVTAIPELLGTPSTGEPQAELWLGTHPGSPALLEDGSPLTSVAELPYLLKVLAAASPLSLQAHPTLAQAREGFERENASGIALDAAERNYRDANHKPEMIVALSEPFRALCGFRDVAETRALLAPLGEAAELLLARLRDESDLPDVFGWLISGGPDVAALVSAIVSAAASVDHPSLPLATVGVLAAGYPGDPGIVISLLLNLVELRRGEALYLPAGNIHAYLSGVGVELMAASDNVLRGGLTPKHVDVAELLGVLDFRALPVPRLHPAATVPGLALYRPPVPDFALAHARGEALDLALPLSGPAIVLCVGGDLLLGEGAAAADAVAGGPPAPSYRLTRGTAVFVRDVATLTLVGAGEAFVAMPGA